MLQRYDFSINPHNNPLLFRDFQTDSEKIFFKLLTKKHLPKKAGVQNYLYVPTKQSYSMEQPVGKLVRQVLYPAYRCQNHFL